MNQTKKEKMVKSEPGFPVLGQAVPAVDRPSFSWLEGDFALFSTVGTDCLCHFSGTEVSRATKTLSFHCYYSCSFDLHIYI